MAFLGLPSNRYLIKEIKSRQKRIEIIRNAFPKDKFFCSKTRLFLKFRYVLKGLSAFNVPPPT
jgi:hypothetical protein